MTDKNFPVILDKEEENLDFDQFLKYSDNDDEFDEYTISDEESNDAQHGKPDKRQDSRLVMKRLKVKYRKSKIGCSACKERKIKCDQRIPSCANCERKNIECPYLMMTPYQIHRINGFQKNTDRLKSNHVDSNDNSLATPEYKYRVSGTINLNSDTNMNDTIYHAHEIENVMLSSSMGNTFVANASDPDLNMHYIPLRTYYIPVQQEKSHPTPEENDPQPLYYNSRRSGTTFNTSHDIILNDMYEFIELFDGTITCLIKQDHRRLMQILKGRQMDLTLYYNYLRNINISQIFSKLMRKSCLLFAMDYYKNTLLKQQMLPSATYQIKLAISCVCENESVVSIDEITKIIKGDYLPYFDGYGTGWRNLFLGCFVVLDDCLGYHFKNGIKYEMSPEDGNKAVHLVGIFSTGMYAIIMERSKEDNLMTSTNVLSTYLITNFRKILIKNYSIKIFEEFKIVFNRLANLYLNDIAYENMKLFLDKHEKLLKLNLHPDSLLGFNNGYLIRIINDFKSITPFDLSDSTYQEASSFVGRESEIVIRILYYTLNQIIEGLMPGIKNLVSGSFSGTEWNIFEFNNIKHLMQMFRVINNKKLKMAAMFLIRVGIFFKCHWLYYKDYLTSFTIDTLLDEDSDMSIHQRYLKLKNFKEEGVMDEIQMKSFLLEKGQFIRRWNYPNCFNLKPKRADKVSANKITNRFYNNEDEMIADFTNNNNGFFSMDHDANRDITGGNSFAKETTFIDGNRMKMLWKLVTYIRINNL